MQLNRLIGDIVAGLLALAVAFFAVFNAIFSDVFGFTQQLGALLYVGVAYVLTTGLVTLAWPADHRRWFTWFVSPALLIIALFTFSEPTRLGFHFMVAAAAVLGAWTGSVLAARLRQVSPHEA